MKTIRECTCGNWSIINDTIYDQKEEKFHRFCSCGRKMYLLLVQDSDISIFPPSKKILPDKTTTMLVTRKELKE